MLTGIGWFGALRMIGRKGLVVANHDYFTGIRRGVIVVTRAELLQSELTIARWAHATIDENVTSLNISHDELPIQMHGAAAATGLALVSNGIIGADIIRLSAGGGFSPHTHPGHHVLVVLGGQGTITYNGRVYPTQAGEVYLVEGSVPHAVGAISDHVILAVGAPHRPVASRDRMKIVGYIEVLSPIGDLHCIICDKQSQLPVYLHDLGCPHCPCHSCVDVKQM